jgi:hypothetical protein
VKVTIAGFFCKPHEECIPESASSSFPNAQSDTCDFREICPCSELSNRTLGNVRVCFNFDKTHHTLENIDPQRPSRKANFPPQFFTLQSKRHGHIETYKIEEGERMNETCW